jgi:hypothetical protein
MRAFNLAVVAAVAVSAASVAQAQTTTYNSAPAAGWVFGHGNDYTPANTAVLDLGNSDQLYMRMHQTTVPAPASDNHGVYSFALGVEPISFDWGISNMSNSDITASITLTNLGTGAHFSYDPFFVGNDNEGPSGYNSGTDGVAQNSFRLNWPTGLNPLGFDSNVDGTYRVSLTVSGFSDGPQTLTTYAKMGAGAGAVPEPASWALMLGGFGAIGGAMRSRRKAAVSFG